MVGGHGDEMTVKRLVGSCGWLIYAIAIKILIVCYTINDRLQIND